MTNKQVNTPLAALFPFRFKPSTICYCFVLQLCYRDSTSQTNPLIELPQCRVPSFHICILRAEYVYCVSNKQKKSVVRTVRKLHFGIWMCQNKKKHTGSKQLYQSVETEHVTFPYSSKTQVQCHAKSMGGGLRILG